MNTLLVLLQEQSTGGSSMWVQLLPLLLIFVVFWLFFILPQRKRAKKQQEYRDALKEGDKVVTIGGIHGKIHSIKETTVVISSGSSTIEVEKSAIVENPTQVGGN